MRGRPRQVPHQSRQRGPRLEARRPVRHHDREGHRAREARAHRRELGLAGPGAPRAPDGREREARRARGSRRGDARGPHRLRARERGQGRGDRPAGRPHHPVVQGFRRAGPDPRLPGAGGALRLPAPPGPHRGRHGLEGHRRLDRRHGRAPAGRHRRHDPRLPHARARRGPHARGHRRAGDPADDGASLLHPAGLGLPGLRAHHEHLLPGARRQDPDLPAQPDARVEGAVSGRRGHARGRHGLRGERPGRVEARRHRHLAARLRAKSPWPRCSWTGRRP